jgi:hypothetical protein
MRGDVSKAVRAQAKARRLLFKEHFSVDGTLMEAAVSVKGCRPREEAHQHKKRRHGPGGSKRRGPGAGRNQDVNFRGERRSNDTQASTTDPDARLAKIKGKEARLSCCGHILVENLRKLLHRGGPTR